jgi:hypothetical protein
MIVIARKAQFVDKIPAALPAVMPCDSGDSNNSSCSQ